VLTRFGAAPYPCKHRRQPIHDAIRWTPDDAVLAARLQIGPHDSGQENDRDHRLRLGIERLLCLVRLWREMCIPDTLARLGIDCCQEIDFFCLPASTHTHASFPDLPRMRSAICSIDLPRCFGNRPSPSALHRVTAPSSPGSFTTTIANR